MGSKNYSLGISRVKEVPSRINETVSFNLASLKIDIGKYICLCYACTRDEDGVSVTNTPFQRVGGISKGMLPKKVSSPEGTLPQNSHG